MTNQTQLGTCAGGGEITMILDRGETTIKAGDIIIQNGTNHARSAVWLLF